MLTGLAYTYIQMVKFRQATQVTSCIQEKITAGVAIYTYRDLPEPTILLCLQISIPSCKDYWRQTFLLSFHPNILTSRKKKKIPGTTAKVSAVTTATNKPPAKSKNNPPKKNYVITLDPMILG
jgi:hypothetical protein